VTGKAAAAAVVQLIAFRYVIDRHAGRKRWKRSGLKFLISIGGRNCRRRFHSELRILAYELSRARNADEQCRSNKSPHRRFFHQ
jgi:hypothetical protein